MTTLADLDLFSLQVFDSIYETQQANITSRQLGVSPSKVSRCLNVLRTVFDDELFYRRQSGLLPTPLAERVQPQVRQLVQGFKQLDQLANPERDVQDKLKLAVLPMVMPAVAECLQHHSYHSFAQQIVLMPWREDSARALHQGELDAGIAMESPNFEDIVSQSMGHCGGVNLVARQDHPIWDRLDSFSLEMLAGFPFFYQIFAGFNDKQDPLETFFINEGIEYESVTPLNDREQWYASMLSGEALSFVGLSVGAELQQHGLRFWRLPEDQYRRLHVKSPRPELFLIERQGCYRRYDDANRKALLCLAKCVVKQMK